MAPLLIGITAGASKEAPGFYLLRWDYTHALSEAGMIPVVLTPGKASRSPAYLDPFAAVVLSGGGDLDPSLYGAPFHPLLRDVNPERDAFEMEIAARALEREMPLLGICRGMQLLNVLHGGTLIQDLPERLGEEISHDDAQRPREVLAHQVRLRSGSRLRGIFGRDTLEVNSFHHQAVDRVGEGLLPVAWSDERVVEAVERPGDPFLLGVQWHPESLWRLGPLYLSLFEALRSAALAYQRKQALRPVAATSGS